MFQNSSWPHVGQTLTWGTQRMSMHVWVGEGGAVVRRPLLPPCTFLGSDTSRVRDLKEKWQENSGHLKQRTTVGHGWAVPGPEMLQLEVTMAACLCVEAVVFLGIRSYCKNLYYWGWLRKGGLVSMPLPSAPAASLQLLQPPWISILLHIKAQEDQKVFLCTLRGCGTSG